jgi:hypothetical protein
MIRNIQKEKLVSRNLFIICTFGLPHYKGKLFFLPLSILVHFNVGNPGGKTNIQTIFDFCPRVLRYVVSYRGHWLTNSLTQSPS